ncbi:hypothetical protein JXA02_00455 [candidate division KSB1 bacterium]|nr:hypothetical protein [candidate division KSB1 bacterium]RQW11470.1 MAG: hypothetical protein EH222_00485 [candidate division KSB1 bacterium]
MHKFIVMGTLLLLPGALSAGSLHLAGLAGRIGLVHSPMAEENIYAFGLNAHLQGAAKVVYRPYFDYWATRIDGVSEQEQRWRLFASGVSALWPFGLHNSSAVPYAGAGVGLQVNDRSKTAEGSRSSADREVDLALTALAGLQLPIRSQFDGFVEFRYAIAGLSDYYGLYLGLMLKLRP